LIALLQDHVPEHVDLPRRLALHLGVLDHQEVRELICAAILVYDLFGLRLLTGDMYPFLALVLRDAVDARHGEACVVAHDVFVWKHADLNS
jgi:hypothetical protein